MRLSGIKSAHTQIGGIYAQDGLDLAKARDSFVRAGEWYKQEDANA
jgi:alpha-soluble NSF attachment protein